MAWRVASEETRDRLLAEEWLKGEDLEAYNLRMEINKRHGAPGSSIRAEGSPSWVAFGVFSALIFTLLGCRNWRTMPQSHTTWLLVLLNVFTITATTLLLHLAFFGRLIAIYTRNRQRVQMLSELLRMGGVSAVDAWWNCRNFVLNEDLALDYDIGGLGVCATVHDDRREQIPNTIALLHRVDSTNSLSIPPSPPLPLSANTHN